MRDNDQNLNNVDPQIVYVNQENWTKPNLLINQSHDLDNRHENVSHFLTKE